MHKNRCNLAQDSWVPWPLQLWLISTYCLQWWNKRKWLKTSIYRALPVFWASTLTGNLIRPTVQWSKVVSLSHFYLWENCLRDTKLVSSRDIIWTHNAYSKTCVPSTMLCAHLMCTLISSEFLKIIITQAPLPKIPIQLSSFRGREKMR